MSTMNVSLPESLKAFVDAQVESRGYATSSEYVRELIRREQERLSLRDLLLEGATPGRTTRADSRYFEGLRTKARRGARK